LLWPAGSCRVTDSASMQALWPPARNRAGRADCHGKEGVAGSSPAEGFRNRSTARFSCFRTGSGDHFLDKGRGRRSESGSGSADQSCCGAPLTRARAARIVGSSLGRVPSGHRSISATADLASRITATAASNFSNSRAADAPAQRSARSGPLEGDVSAQPNRMLPSGLGRAQVQVLSPRLLRTCVRTIVCSRTDRDSP
jgi:hypothetical protein